MASAAPYAAAAPVNLDLDYTIPVQSNQVAFVPFAGDTVISPIATKVLNTDLKTTSQNLPEQPHTSREVASKLQLWQSIAIPYVVVGNTRTVGSEVVIDYEVVNTQTGRAIEGKQTLKSKRDANSMRYAANVIADNVHHLITGEPSDFAGRIAYIEESGIGAKKVSRIKVMDATGENETTISEVQGSMFSPAWSPDGKRIAYAVQRDKSYAVIYVQNVNGGGANAITRVNGSSLSPSFSPDGGRILFSGTHEGGTNIYEISASGGTPRRLTKGWQPSYAPDGQSFAFVYDNEKNNQPRIYRYNFGSGSIQQISRGGYATTPQFNADGSQIAYLSGRSAAVMTSGGGNVASFGGTGLDEAPSFSPSGKRVVIATKQGSKGALTIKSLSDGTTLTKTGDGIIRSPVWSVAAQ
ncbi:Tol-Pal system beta propeller repeat protein TolB [Psychrobacter aestuarii]|uniref:Tol-Pal system beta propeller repeat protein TolB n=2 Tax=Psychrobacter aestuarii TaxID=556327 RepID=A0ABN0VXK7_9GAMM